MIPYGKAHSMYYVYITGLRDLGSFRKSQMSRDKLTQTQTLHGTATVCVCVCVGRVELRVEKVCV